MLAIYFLNGAAVLLTGFTSLTSAFLCFKNANDKLMDLHLSLSLSSTLFLLFYSNTPGGITRLLSGLQDLTNTNLQIRMELIIW